MSTQEQTDIIRDAPAIEDIGNRIAASGRFAMDLEFMSADRYIPDLALVQLAWTEDDELQMVLVDGVDTELSPIFDQVESKSVLTVAHGAKQDLSLLSMRYGIVAGAFVDTQIAAAFAGIAEQIGYANLVDKLLRKHLDKGPQFTDWMRRPLSEKQLRYALDDVRYLFPVWDEMKTTLRQHERIEWVMEESAILSSSAANRRPAEEAYKKIGGANNLKGSALGALRELASWRDSLAVERNIPPSWIIPDAAAVEVCRRNVKTDQEFKKIRGLGSGILSKYGEGILAAVQKGRHDPVASGSILKSLDTPQQAQATVIVAIVAGRAAEIGMSARAIGTKADAEALVRFAIGQVEATDCRLLRGWRQEVVGALAVDWLKGQAHLVSDPKLGVRVIREELQRS